MSGVATGYIWKRKARFVSHGCAVRKREEIKTRLEHSESSRFRHPACLSLCLNFVSGMNLERMIKKYISAFSCWPLLFINTVLLKGNTLS